MASNRGIAASSTATAREEAAARDRGRVTSSRRVTPARVRLFGVLIAVCALTLALSAASAQALLLPISTFGSGGSGANQLQTPLGVAVDQVNGFVYVADSANARVDLFSASGKFLAAFGWGVADGKSQAEICTSSCQAGIAGSGPGQFSKPTSVAVDSSNGPSHLDVYVGDQGNNVVEKFNALGVYLSTIDGSTTPQGKYSSLAGVAVDQSGNLWTADGNTDNIDQFDPTGKFVQQWTDPFGNTTAIAVDSTNGLVYLTRGSGETESFTLTGGNETTVDNGTATALAVDPKSGNLYVDHGGDVVVYGPSGSQVDSFSLISITASQGLAFGTTAGDLYVSDSSNNSVTIFGTPSTPGPPLVFGESGTQTGTDTATVNAMEVPFGLDTTCSVQYVDDGTFQSSGYTNATSVPCTPADIGSSFTSQSVSADLTGLSAATTYHFRFVAQNSDGTTNGADTTFETAGPPAVVPGSESATNITDSKASLNGSANPTGLDTTCTFQYVDNGDFQATGYDNAQSVACSPSDLGSSFSPQSASADVTGLAPGTTYHFRLVASNSAGTTPGPDETFQTHLSFLIGVGTFGNSGTADGQFQRPTGLATGPSNVYVDDTLNARVEKFTSGGSFVSAWGWGVSDGKAQSEVCTSNCQAGIPGGGGGQLKTPSTVAVGGSKVYVGDSGTNQVEVFSTAGKFLSVIDGATTPQGHFQSLSGVAVDASGNVWTSDAGTGNVDEFSSSGKFLQQWSDSVGSPTGIAVDSAHSAVYLINNGSTTRFSPTGTNPTNVDNVGATALALDPTTGILYVDHGGDVAIYDHNGLQIDALYSLGFTTNSQGIAYLAGTGHASRLYASDANNGYVTLYGPRPAGRPFITTDSATQTGKTTATVNAAIVPLGKTTTCTVQYVDDADFQSSGYSAATSIGCTPSSLGSGFTYAEASATLTNLAATGLPGTTYHFRVVTTSSAGTTTSGDQTFRQVNPWAPFDRCPVDNFFMRSADGVNTEDVCVAANSTHGSITLGTTTSATGNTNLQFGLLANNGTFPVIAPSGGAIVSDPVQISSPLGPVSATVQSAGSPSNFNLIAGLEVGEPIVTVPIEIHLENSALGPNCFIGSNQNPILLKPENTDLSNATSTFTDFDFNGVPDPNGPLDTLLISGAVQGDNSFAVPGAQGCGTNGNLNSAVNAVVGLPSPAGSNHLVLQDASSALVIPAGQTPVNGAQFAFSWHASFG